MCACRDVAHRVRVSLLTASQITPHQTNVLYVTTNGPYVVQESFNQSLGYILDQSESQFLAMVHIHTHTHSVHPAKCLLIKLCV